MRGMYRIRKADAVYRHTAGGGNFALRRPSDVHEYFSIADLTLPDLGPFPLASAGAVLDPDVPTMPAADHFARLHDPFTQRKSKMRTEILDRVDAVIPPEQCEI